MNGQNSALTNKAKEQATGHFWTKHEFGNKTEAAIKKEWRNFLSAGAGKNQF
jgi:hypothetical protein